MNTRFLVLLVPIACTFCAVGLSQTREQVPAARGLAYATKFRGSWRTLVSGKQDRITSSELTETIRRLEALHAGRNTKSADAARKWARNFRQWIKNAKDGVVQPGSSYEQHEEFTFSSESFWKKNVHRNGYDPNLRGSGVEQLLRKKGRLIVRKTLVGFDEVFEISKDDPQILTLPSYAVLAGDCIQVRAFVKRRGKREANRSGVWIYSGETPALPGAFYPAWYDVDSTLMVLREHEPVDRDSTSHRYTISLRDLSGGPMQEVEVLEKRKIPWDVRKRVYLPFSSILYNESHVRVIEWKRERMAVPSFMEIASTPVAAEHVIDTRYHNVLVPVNIAAKGDAAIRRYIGLEDFDEEKGSDGPDSPSSGSRGVDADVDGKGTKPSAGQLKDSDSATVSLGWSVEFIILGFFVSVVLLLLILRARGRIVG